MTPHSHQAMFAQIPHIYLHETNFIFFHFNLVVAQPNYLKYEHNHHNHSHASPQISIMTVVHHRHFPYQHHSHSQSITAMPHLQ